jgi:hypothetical protein
MSPEVLALILIGAAAALAQRRLNKSRGDDRPELAPVRVRVDAPARRRRSR